MAQEIKFNHFGIPYVVEFANVTFRPSCAFKRSQTTPLLPTLSRTDSCSTNETYRSSPPAHSFFSSRSRSSSRSHTLHRRRSSSPTESLSSWCSIPPYEPPREPEPPNSETAPQGRGLYIQFSSSFPTSEPPPSYFSRPEPIRSKHAVSRLRQTIASAVRDAGMESPSAVEKQNLLDTKDTSRPTQQKSSKSLFKGTYGQVMSALKDAGLMITPCTEAGFEEATRLGALFVVGPNEDGGVELTKLTLWG